MYTPELAGSGQRGPCADCGMPPSREGHDGCLGMLPGPIWNACCGHGRQSMAYIQYEGGASVRGRAAIIEQARIKRQQ